MIASVLIGAVAPAFGVYLVLRRLSLIADTLSHVALAGVAIALLTRIYPPYLALAATTSAAVSIEELRARRMLPGDAVLAVFLYGALAIAIVVIGIAGGFNASLFSFLFGSILTVTTEDLWLAGALAGVVTLFLLLFSEELAQISLDSDLARINGVPVRRVNLLLAIVTGATITMSMRVVGVLLIGALIVVPVLIALRLSSGLTRTVMVASAVGVVVSLAGVLISFYADIAPGGSVVLTGIGLLIIVETGAYIRGRSRRRMVDVPDHVHGHTVHAHAAGGVSEERSSEGESSGPTQP